MTDKDFFSRTVREAATERKVIETVALTPHEMYKLLVPIMQGKDYSTSQIWMQAKRIGEVERAYVDTNLDQDDKGKYDIE